MNFMTLPPTQARAMRMRAPLHELALVEIADEPAADAEADFSRCGWFDSSLELAAGLQVIEFIDALPADLPFQAV